MSFEGSSPHQLERRKKSRHDVDAGEGGLGSRPPQRHSKRIVHRAYPRGHMCNDTKIEEENCDRTTSEMRGLSPKIILGDSRRSENAQTHTYKHTVPHMKFKLKLLQIKCHVLGLTKTKPKICFKR
jgi:hypothetical protein